MKRIEESYDLVVAGGGLAGVCAAIAAARGGLKTCLVHERPVLGGVASSEMRVTVHGAAQHHSYARESGIIGEMLSEERARNHEPINENGWTNSAFDMVLYDFCTREKNLSLHLNTPVTQVMMHDGEQVEQEPHTRHGYYHRPACNKSRRIAGLIAHTLSAELELCLRANYFLDATGDAYVADRAGCEWRMGCESKAEFNETHAPLEPSTDTMGNSIHIRAKNIGAPAPYSAPEWAVKHEDASFFYEQGRRPSDPNGGYWWIEIGVPWHTIHDNEEIRHQLTRHALGVWDWMKNRDPVMKRICANYALDFVGQVPGKRESRRVLGRHWITENELAERRAFPDEVGHGGWFLDLHTTGGLLADSSEPAAAEGYRVDSEYAALSYIGPYGFPLRSLMAKDVDNLFLAGRCISTSRAALGTVRVMGTTSIMGQAVGTAAAIMKKRGLDFASLEKDAAQGGAHIQSIQQTLLRNGVFLPNFKNNDAEDLATQAIVSASSSAKFHGQSADDPQATAGPLYHPHTDPCGPSLEKMHAQHCYLSGALDSIRLQLTAAKDSKLSIRLVRTAGIWDYRQGGSEVIASTTLSIPAGAKQWCEWHCKLTHLIAGSYRIETLAGAETLRWHKVASIQPGHYGQETISPTRLRDLRYGFALQLSPAQCCYQPEQILSGVCRPQNATNCWRSDSVAGLPAWIQLDWDNTQTIKTVEISFAGHLLAEVHTEPPFWRDTQTVKDYAIQFESKDGWHTALQVNDNYQRQRQHLLPQAITTRRLRILVTATNGDPVACVYEIRCYS